MEKTKSAGTAAAKKIPVSNIPGIRLSALKTAADNTEIILRLCRDIAAVRTRNDLEQLFAGTVEGLPSGARISITLIDQKSQTYSPFFPQEIQEQPRTTNAWTEQQKVRFQLSEPCIQSVLDARRPVVFLPGEITDKDSMPDFLKQQSCTDAGEIMVATLSGNNRPAGFVHISSGKKESFSEESRNIIRAVLPVFSVCIVNIRKNEELLRKEYEKAILLDFSNAIATVRNKEEFAVAIKTVLGKINPLRGYVIRNINEDGVTMGTYIFDASVVPTHANTLKNEVLESRFPINDGLQNRVLDSSIPLLFSVDMEINRGITAKYLHFWKKMGFSTVVGIALRTGNKTLGILWLGIDEININLLQAICAQVSIAMENILSHEKVTRKENEQSSLLDFSTAIAGVMTKTGFESAIMKVLQQLLDTSMAMIQVIDEDGRQLSPYLFDQAMFTKITNLSLAPDSCKIQVQEYYTNLVLNSSDPVCFRPGEGIHNPGNPIAVLWSQTPGKHLYGSALRVGNRNLGTFWILANQVSQSLFKGICAQVSVVISTIMANEKKALYKQQLEKENNYLRQQIKTISAYPEIIGAGVAMTKVYRLMSQVAGSAATVLILGETGTGKELIARALHSNSPRRDKLMVKLNCAAMPANLIESELFGHERGAFTGALDKRIGKFELADKGTLFLDEIGEMPLEAQVKLLRVLQEKELERVGGKTTIKVDVRIIAATNRNLETEVKEGRFRADLYYRLNVFPISLPPLRERLEDIELLTEFFTARSSKSVGKNIRHIAAKVMLELKAYPWPGNIRELEHLLERSILLAEQQDEILKEIYLPHPTTGFVQGTGSPTTGSLEKMERYYITQVLRNCNGRITGSGGAAAVLEIPGTTLHSKMKKLRISKSDYFSE